MRKHLLLLLLPAALFAQAPSFLTRQSYNTQRSHFLAAGLSIADCNADGVKDLIDWDSAAGISVQIGNGDGTFRQGPVGTSGAGYVAVTGMGTGDFDGDGRIDAILYAKEKSSQNQGFAILHGNSDCSFTQISFTPLVLNIQVTAETVQ